MITTLAALAILLYTLHNYNRDVDTEVLEVMYKRNFDSLYVKYGEKYGIEPELLKAHAVVESNENPQAVGPTNDYGLFQIVYPQKLTAVLNWNEASKERLLNDPEFNIDVACQIMKWNHSKYSFNKAIAVYNSWGARLDPDLGPFRNQEYVNKVVHLYSQFVGSNYFPLEVQHTWE